MCPIDPCNALVLGHRMPICIRCSRRNHGPLDSDSGASLEARAFFAHQTPQPNYKDGG
jgi:hypothetical protein